MFVKWIRLVVIVAIAIVAPMSVWAENIVFPADAGVVDITRPPYGAKGDGKTDDTAALQKASDENKQKMRMLYFPNGTYLVSQKLSYGTNLEQAKCLVLQGQSEKGTILKLKDNLPAFGNPAKALPLLTMFEGDHTGMAFQNSIFNMTFDVGKGNPGATGVQWMNNNQGAMRQVTIRSSDPSGAGAVGLDLTKIEPGPGLVSFVTIEGFDYAMDAMSGPFSMTFEHVTIRNQRKVGVRNKWHTMIFRDLKSFNKVPAFVATDGAYYCITDSVLAGGAPDQPAILNQSDSIFFLRDVKQEGYGKLLQQPKGGKDILDKSVSEYVTHNSKASSAFGDSPRKTLRLPIQETPVVAWDPLDKWLVVDPKALSEEAYDSEIIQDAMNLAAKTGKTTVCLPTFKTGDIRFDDTVNLAVREPGKYTLTVRYSDGLVKTWPADLTEINTPI